MTQSLDPVASLDPAASPPVAFTEPAAPAEPPSVAVDDMAALVARLWVLEDQTRRWVIEADEIKAAIQDRLDDSEVGTIDGRPVVTWKHHERHTLDQQQLRRCRPEVYAAYRRTSVVRRFALAEEPEA